ncbi:MAG: transporter substrate-binding domain-containing protein [Marinobacter sp.]|uniref:substrate-binding periplasmic protein n=1 Tax=Marinobacter sp. TaxID=50741 RepID=UPI003298F51D
MGETLSMDFRPVVLGVIGTVALSVCYARPPELNLYTFASSPYQVPALGGPGDSKVVGETADTVNCAASRAGWSTRIRITPQNRAVHSLQRNLIDGYFAIDPSIELDTTAKRSNPVALEKWYFFTTDPDVVPETARIGVVDGSNEEAWLENNGFDVFMSVSLPSQLLALLKRGRIDAALMDRRAMIDLHEPDKSRADELNAHFLRYAPLYMYLSENFTANNPDFLPAFNQFLPACMEGQITLTADEEARIKNLSERLFNEIEGMLNLQQAIDAGPPIENLTDVLTFDAKWQALAPATTPELAKAILELPGSRTLHAWKLTHRDTVTEALLTNNLGTLVAMSQLASDYWQGDEPKFTHVVENTLAGSTGVEAMYLSDIRYDASTSRFQVTVSAPVGPVSDGLPKGVVILGLDIEKALGSR